MKKLGLLAMALCLTMFVAGCEEKKAEKPKAGTPAAAGKDAPTEKAVGEKGKEEAKPATPPAEPAKEPAK